MCTLCFTMDNHEYILYHSPRFIIPVTDVIRSHEVHKLFMNMIPENIKQTFLALIQNVPLTNNIPYIFTYNFDP